VRVLLSDGAGLTSRQVATILGRAGHHVEVLDAAGFALTHATRWVRRAHRVPPIGRSPAEWLAAAIAVLERDRFDALLPTQEQVAVLARFAAQISAPVAVPPWDALRRVQDKLSAAATLTEAGLPQPPSTVAADRAALDGVTEFPVFVKHPIGTASAGVQRVDDRSRLPETVDDGLLIQRAVDGPLLMVQSVFDHGRLVAWHACRRAREGSNGGASHKISDPRPEVAGHLRALGALLGWHGALSMDAIVTADGPLYIDVNPRLVEPVNALRSGVDLVGALLGITLGETVPAAPAPRPGVRTHQLILALTKAATVGGRGAVARELAHAATGTGPYRDSAEELTPARGDLRTALLVTAVGGGLLVRPRLAGRLTGGAVASYSLTPSAWRELLEARDNRGLTWR